MIKAGALYFAIVIAFFIATISASLLILASHSRGQYFKEIRFNRMLNNLNSGVAITLENRTETDSLIAIDLYGDGTDSIIITKKRWGIFDVAIITSFIAQDTLQKALIMGKVTDSVAIYLSDEDRPLSLSGTTKISGHALLPKSGLRRSYAEGKSYRNNKLIYNGKISASSRKLPPLDTIILNSIKKKLQATTPHFPLLSQSRLTNSFLDSTLSFKLKPKAILKNFQLKGNLILYADSTITITASTHLDGVQLYAPYIRIEDGFKGSCQLFASDSISIGKNVYLNYPSVAAVVSIFKLEQFPKITLSTDATFEGILFTYQEKRTALQTLISIAGNSQVKGEIYAGLIKLDSGVNIAGKASCNRFLMQTSTSVYENFLIDVNLNRTARSNYYLSSPLFNNQLQNKVLKWLN